MDFKNEKINKFLLNIVDVAWNECTESTEVPSTDWAKKIIDKANINAINLFTEPVLSCNWESVNFGGLGYNHYEYVTTCGTTYDSNKISKGNYCPNCGGKIN